MSGLQRYYLASVAGLPLALALLLTFARPDVVGGMFGHRLGIYTLVAFLFFWLGGSGLTFFVFSRVNAAIPGHLEGNASRRKMIITLTSVGASFFCVTPACLTAVFGPIFAAMLAGRP